MQDHDPVNLEEMTRQYQGKTLPDLLALHFKTIPQEILPQVLRGTFMAFEHGQHRQLDAITDNDLQNWLEPHISAMDLVNCLV